MIMRPIMRIAELLLRTLPAPRSANRDRGWREFAIVSFGAKRDTHARPTAGLTCAIALMLGIAAAGARAGQQPLWEAGAGAAALSFPAYRGANERQSWLLPFPYIVYRGEFLQADERRIRGLFYETDRAEIDVSVNGSVPVDSGKNDARRGMPDLDATLEIGPGLNLRLMETGDRRTRLELRLPLRAVFASDFPMSGTRAGCFSRRSTPTSAIRWDTQAGSSGCSLGRSIPTGAITATSTPWSRPSPRRRGRPTAPAEAMAASR